MYDSQTCYNIFQATLVTKLGDSGCHNRRNKSRMMKIHLYTLIVIDSHSSQIKVYAVLYFAINENINIDIKV